MQTDALTLPQLGGELFLTEVGIETCLIFYDGIDLPCFATFPLLDAERPSGIRLAEPPARGNHVELATRPPGGRRVRAPPARATATRCQNAGSVRLGRAAHPGHRRRLVGA